MKNGIYIKHLGDLNYFLVQHYESKDTLNGAPVVVSEQIMSGSYKTEKGAAAYAHKRGFSLKGTIVNGTVRPVADKSAKKKALKKKK